MALGGRRDEDGGGGIPDPANEMGRFGGTIEVTPVGGGAIVGRVCGRVVVGGGVCASPSAASSSDLGTTLDDMVVMAHSEDEGGIVFTLVTPVNTGLQVVIPSV